MEMFLNFTINSVGLVCMKIKKRNIEQYWKDKPVRFAYMNNCVGCFHRNKLLLKKMYQKHPNKMNWFEKQELNRQQLKD